MGIRTPGLKRRRLTRPLKKATSQSDGSGEAQRQAERHLEIRVAKDQASNVARPCAERHPETDFLRALANRIHRDGIESGDGEREGDATSAS